MSFRCRSASYPDTKIGEDLPESHGEGSFSFIYQREKDEQSHLLICIATINHSFTNNELEIFNTALGGLVQYWNFSFIVSELVQENPDNSLAEYVNL